MIGVIYWNKMALGTAEQSPWIRFGVFTHAPG